MKNMKTWLSALLAVMMLLAMTGIAMADAVPTGSITVENLESGETVTIYQVIEIEPDGTAALKDPKWDERDSGVDHSQLFRICRRGKSARRRKRDGVQIDVLQRAVRTACKLTAVKNEQVTAATYTVENQPIGSYMVLVMGGEKAA